MSASITIYYEAKCKHCLYFEYNHTLKKDGTKSKRMTAFCKNKESVNYMNALTLKSKVCNQFAL